VLFIVFGIMFLFVSIPAWMIAVESKKIKQRRFAEFQEAEDVATARYFGRTR